MPRPASPIALVTGGSGGIGSAIVRRLAADGMTVTFTHRGDSSRAQELVASCTAAGQRAHDMDSDDSDAAAIKALHRGLSALVLVHCAGIARDGACWKQEVEDYDATMAVNLRAAWLHLRACAPVMRAARWGRVVFVGSINGSRGKAGQTIYAASKAGLIGLARSAAKELGNRGVTVNVIEPGWVDTAMTRGLPAELRERALGETMTGRLTLPEDVAAAASFLCGDAAAQITGQILRVDGGQWCG
jgi:3-oxoacyl-[acyl-carrier protein] reductase